LFDIIVYDRKDCNTKQTARQNKTRDLRNHHKYLFICNTGNCNEIWGATKMSLQNPSYAVIELTKRILEIEALSDYNNKAEHTIHYYIGNDYVDEKGEYTNTYSVFKNGNEIAIREFISGDSIIKAPRLMTIEDFAQFANNNKLQLFSFRHKRKKHKHPLM
jgi:hypothetical protein